MAILDLKPHRLEYLSVSEGYEDEYGDYHSGSGEWLELCECDVVPAGPANQIALPDGTTVQYSYTIYLPRDTREFLVGEKVRVSLFGEGVRREAREFSVKGFHRYQLQSKMWV